MKTMQSRFPGTCQACGGRFPQGTTILWSKETGARHTSCPVLDCPPPTAVKIVLAPVASFIQKAKDRGLKFPKVRFLAPDGKSELRLSVAGSNSKYAGGIQVKINGLWIGAVRPNGDASPAITADALLVAALLKIAEDPAAAAKAYAQLFCRCSFCGLELTDEGSVLVGYGPICAKNYDLPHTPLGTPEIGAAPLQIDEHVQELIHAQQDSLWKLQHPDSDAN